MKHMNCQFIRLIWIINSYVYYQTDKLADIKKKPTSFVVASQHSPHRYPRAANNHRDLDQTSHNNNNQNLSWKENNLVNEEKIKPTHKEKELNRGSVGNLIKLLGVEEIHTVLKENPLICLLYNLPHLLFDPNMWCLITSQLFYL